VSSNSIRLSLLVSLEEWSATDVFAFVFEGVLTPSELFLGESI